MHDETFRILARLFFTGFTSVGVVMMMLSCMMGVGNVFTGLLVFLLGALGFGVGRICGM